MARKLLVLLVLAAAAAPVANANTPRPAQAAAARACGEILKRIGFDSFQTRFKAPETCVAQLAPSFTTCLDAGDPEGCMNARIEAVVREYTGEELLSGGVYSTPSGAQVRVVSSEASGVDDAGRQWWAEYLDRLLHGDELAAATLRLSTPQSVARTCGPSGLACYLPVPQTIIAAPATAPGAPLVPSPESLVAHEYGHHLANSRLNAPWSALERGTKRWATYMQICDRVRTGELVTRALWGPGYRVSPAEGFAEAYRVLNETRRNAEAPWLLVDERFRPDANALKALERDVLEPWLGPRTATFSGRGNRTFRVATPLDGALRVRVAAERGSAYRVSAPAIVCGRRSTAVHVRRVRGSGAFRLTVSRP